MKKYLFIIIVALFATLDTRAVEVEFFPRDTVNPELEGFHLYPNEKNMQDVTSLIDFLLSPRRICENQIVFIDINADGWVNIEDVVCLIAIILGDTNTLETNWPWLLTGQYPDDFVWGSDYPHDPSEW